VCLCVCVCLHVKVCCKCARAWVRVRVCCPSVIVLLPQPSAITSCFTDGPAQGPVAPVGGKEVGLKCYVGLCDQNLHLFHQPKITLVKSSISNACS
jgi:hypothetical protein